MKSWIVSLLISALQELLMKVTPELLDYAREGAKKFYLKAKRTESPWDDMVAGLALVILGVNTPDEGGEFHLSKGAKAPPPEVMNFMKDEGII
jgi:hypothetical protein